MLITIGHLSLKKVLKIRGLLKYFFISLWLLLLPITVTAAPYKVLRVIDGDTREILYRGKAKKVEFICVDTPDPLNTKKGGRSCRE